MNMVKYLLLCLVTATISSADEMFGFTAETSNNGYVCQGNILAFDRVITDTTGGSFYPEVGIFECPDDAWYTFFWTLHAPAGRVAASLIHKGQVVKEGPLTPNIEGQDSGSSSMAAIVRCEPEDRVWLMAEAFPGSEACNQLQGSYSSFTGFRLYSRVVDDPPAFMVQLGTNQQVEKRQTILFDDVIYNIGGHYNREDGTFTCPEDGLYLFANSMHVNSASNGLNTARLNRGEQFLFSGPRVHSREAGGPDSGTSTASFVIQCEAGQPVYVEPLSEAVARKFYTSWMGIKLPVNSNFIAFQAQISVDKEYINGEILEFNNATVNVANHYVESSDGFICPDDAVYFIQWSVRAGDIAQAQRPVESHLIKKVGGATTVIKTGSRSNPATDFDIVPKSVSTHAVVECEEGATLHIQAVIEGNDAMVFRFYGSSFLGLRLGNEF